MALALGLLTCWPLTMMAFRHYGGTHGLKMPLLLALLAIVASAPSCPAQERLRLLLGPASLRVDGSSGRDEETFGSIEAAAITPRGFGVVADRARQRLVILRPLSVHKIKVVGRIGSGPGEIREPKSLQVIGDSIVVLLDRRLARFTRFAISETTVKVLGSSAVHPVPDDACLAGDQLVVFRYDPAHRTMLRWTRTEVRQERFVAEPFSRGGPRLDAETSQGQLLCTADADRVTLAAFGEGEIRGFTARGDSVWTVTIPEVIPWDVKLISNGGVAWRLPPVRGVRQAHSLVSLVRLDAGHILVQYGLLIQGRNREADLTFPSIESRVIRLSDGAVVGRQTDLPIIRAARGQTVLVAGGEPDLWVELRSFTLSRSR